MKRLTTMLAATVAALAANAGTAFGASPVQSTIQSAGTGQAALAASSATQVQPTNQNISVRVLSPGNDGSVSQSNTATSSANAANTATTTQTSGQTLNSLCGCSMPAGVSGVVDHALQGYGTGAAAPASAASAPATSTQAAPAPAPAAATQANNATSTGTAANTAPTSQTSSQSQAGSGGVQSSKQDASTDQTAAAASSAEQVKPTNSNVSVRILSPGDDGSVSQSNNATSHADATNSATTTQGSSQGGSGGSGVQSSTQSADTTQKAIGLSSAKQIDPSNSNVSVRILSPGEGGSVSQSNDATSTADATNDAPVTQSAMQDQAGSSSCGCSSDSGPAVQAIGQSSSIDQGALAASSAFQLDPSNLNAPVRIGSSGDDGAVTQSNAATSDASASNTAPVEQTGTQDQSGSSCDCSSGPAVQALGQSSEIGQLGVGLSSAKQIGASNANDPVRIGSDGSGGDVTQSNDATSTGTASNTAPTTQSGSQTQDGSGVQAVAQDSSVWQAALAASEAAQYPGKSRCGCGGSSSGNSSDPVRIASVGDDGSLTQSNDATSHADAPNVATPTQTTMQDQSSGCGCSGLGVQALGQQSTVDQLAAALSAAKQFGASNDSAPVRIWTGDRTLLPAGTMAVA